MALNGLEKFAIRLFERAGKHRIYLRERGDLHVFSRHEILDDIASDLVAGMEGDLHFQKRIVVFCGLHKRFGPFQKIGGFRVGVQTEHYFDEEGKYIGRRHWEISKILKAVKSLDAILDINPGNRPIYDSLSARDRAKIVFGPHIFPVSAPRYQPSTNSLAVFVGGLNDRRKNALERLDSKRFERISSGKFGNALVEALGEYGAILNIHHDDGIYTEAPRILIALKAGKPLVSEALSSEWTAGEHYIFPEDFDGTAELARIHAAMAKRCTEDFAFQNYLKSLNLQGP